MLVAPGMWPFSNSAGVRTSSSTALGVDVSCDWNAATSKLSFKDTSGDYVFATDDNGNAILDKHKNPMYYTDLFSVVEAFKDFGLGEFNNGDTVFDFLANV